MAQDNQKLATKLFNYTQTHNIPGGLPANTTTTYNPRYKGFDEANYRKLESKIDALGLTGSKKQQAMDELYQQVLPIVQAEALNSDRRKYINDASYEVSQIQDKSAQTMARGKLTVTELAQQVKEKFNLSPTAPDEDVFNDWISQIPNGEQLLVNYLNNGDRELLYIGGLETPIETPEQQESETTGGGIQSIINKQSELDTNTPLGKINSYIDWINIIGKGMEKADSLVQRIPVVDGKSQADNLANKMNNLSEDELSNLYDRYVRMIKSGSKDDDRGWFELLWDGITGDKQAIDRLNTLQLADYSEAMPQDGVERNQRGTELLGGLDTEEKEGDNLIVKGAKKLTNLNKNLLNFIGGSWGGLENYAEAAGVGLQKLDDVKDKRRYVPQDMETNEDAFKAFVADRTANLGEYLVDAPDMLMGRTLSPNAAKFVANIPGSFLKTLSSKLRAATNPLDTKIGLAKMLFTDEGQQAMINRYGTVDDIANTMNSDPVGLASDIIDRGDKINWAFNKATGGAVERQPIGDITDVLSQDTAMGIRNGLDFISQRANNKGWNKTAGLVDISRDAAFNPGQVVNDIAKESGMIARDVADVPSNTQEWFRERANQKVQNINRMTKKQQEKFMQMSDGIEQGEFQNMRGLRTLDDLADHLTKNLEQVDTAMEGIEGRFKSKKLDAVVDDVVKYATDTEDPQAGRLQKLARKNSEGGLTMSEINEIKRFYERTTIFDYLKDTSGSKKARTATNRDTALREWQQKVAADAGLDNLKELNKETQLTKYILDNASNWKAGVRGNNDITLTDWIVASGGGLDVNSIASLVGKKVYQSNRFQNKLVDVYNYLGGRETVEGPKVDMEKIQQSNVNRAILAEELSRVQNEKQFNAWLEKARDMNPALPYDSRYDNQEPIDYTSPTRVTPGGQAIRAGQISEVGDVPANYKTPNDTTDTQSDLYTKQSPSRIKVMEDAIIDEYGTTNNPSQVAFVDNEGRWINGNGRKQGNFRDIDHRDYAYTAFGEDNMESFKNATDGLNALQAQMGLVRVSYDDGRLDIDTVYKLTPDQIEGIERFADGKISEVNVDITNATDGTILNSDTFDNVRDALRFINKNFIDDSEK